MARRFVLRSRRRLSTRDFAEKLIFVWKVTTIMLGINQIIVHCDIEYPTGSFDKCCGCS